MLTLEMIDASPPRTRGSTFPSRMLEIVPRVSPARGDRPSVRSTARTWPAATKRVRAPKRAIGWRARSTARRPRLSTRSKIASTSASDREAVPCASRRARGRSSSGQSVIAISTPQAKVGGAIRRVVGRRSAGFAKRPHDHPAKQRVVRTVSTPTLPSLPAKRLGAISPRQIRVLPRRMHDAARRVEHHIKKLL